MDKPKMWPGIDKAIKDAHERSDLLSDAQIEEAISNPSAAQVIATIVSLALEVREYRRIYGPLGCSWLAADLRER